MSRFINTFRPSPNLLDDEGNTCIFWCQECDSNKVHSDDPKTGLFFCMTGHQLFAIAKCRKAHEPKTPEYPHVGDPWLTVVMALCPDCMVSTEFIDLIPDDIGNEESFSYMRLPECIQNERCENQLQTNCQSKKQL